MENILLVFYVLTELLYIFIIINIIFSWINILWWNFKINFINSILDPIYENIKKIIPTVIWPFEIAPLILIIILSIFQLIIYKIDPNVLSTYKNIIKF